MRSHHLVLEAHDLAFAWNASKPIFQGVSFQLGQGFHGLVGANGAGKTTLLSILAGLLAPTSGRVRLSEPSSMTTVYCPQTVDDDNDDVRALAEAHDGLAMQIKGRLLLEAEQLERWPTLSPGERKRWQIGAALAREPDVLLLDEPTNHLDVEARDRLLDALTRFRGIGVIVSHDRAVLERLPRSILRVADGAVTVHAGRYSDARGAWEATRREREDAHAHAKAVVRTAERKLDAARRTREAAEHSISTRTRMKDKNDSDARGMLAKNLARWAEARAGRTVRVVADQVERLREDVPVIERDRTIGGKVFATYERAPNANLFHLSVDALRSEDDSVTILHDVRVTIAREDRARITGMNGAGKTTLLRALVNGRGTGSSSHTPDRILYLPQELSPLEIAANLDLLRSLDPEERGRVLTIFSALGSDPERVLGRSDHALSPGEARKLALSLGLGRHVWALVLDEPTNHLDLPTIERLENALCTYPGCIVLVTHDDAFAAKTTSRSIHVSDGLVHTYVAQ